MHLKKQFLPLMFSASWVLAAASNAQVLEDVAIEREGRDAVVHFKFVAPVQYTRAVGTQKGDLLQIFYVVRPVSSAIVDARIEKQIAGSGRVPTIVVTDEADTNSTSAGTARKLIVRLGSSVRFRVQPGRNEQTIRLVLSGLGEGLSVSRPEPRTASPRFVVTLQSTTEAGRPLAASVPSNLQAYEVFTASRSVEGTTYHDVNVGYFSSRAEAESARALALARFPEAQVRELTPPAVVSRNLPERPDAPAAGTSVSEPQQASSAGADVEQQGLALLTAAQVAFDSGRYPEALDQLNELLNLPPNSSSRRAQELAGLARLNAGDRARAKLEFELFLKLYPVGTDSDRVRELAASIPSGAAVEPSADAGEIPPESTTTGSFSTFYYGGKSDVRTQEFRNSVLSGLPVLQSDATLSNVDQRLLQSNLDLSWRFKNADKDMRFVLRDSYSVDLMPNGTAKERLSALYFEHRSVSNGTSIRIGRQSPNGGGVLYRFDGVQAGYAFKPKWKLNAVFGSPSDALLDTRRSFYGLSVDAEQLTKELSGSIYVLEQTIDGVTDRRAYGFDARYFRGGLSASTQFDFDQVLNAVNIAALQANWQVTETTLVNAMVDRRTTPVLSLGNVLFFQDPALAAPARRIQELLGTTPLEVLREQVKGLTPYQTQARIAGTAAINAKWQTGADVSVTNVDEIRPVAVLLPNGQPGTGNLWSVSAQLIGSNLYSGRDTHVFNLSQLGGPTYRGFLASYNNLSALNEKWQIEPSFKLFGQDDVSGSSVKTVTAGLRTTFRMLQKVAFESELTYERSEATSAPAGGASNSTSSSRLNYSFGGRYDF